MFSSFKKIASKLISSLFFLLLVACGGSGGTDGGEVAIQPPPVNTLQGKITANVVSDATVDIYLIENNTIGTSIAYSGTSDASGNFSISIEQYSGSILIQITNGTYVDEATGNNFNNTTTISALAPSSSNFINVSPLTELSKRLSGVDLGSSITLDEINAANDRVAVIFSGSGAEKIDIIATNPVVASSPFPSSATTDQKNYGYLLAMLSQYNSDIDTGLINLLAGITANGLSSTLYIDLSSSLDIFLNGGFNQSGEMAAGLVSFLENSGNTQPSFSNRQFNVTLGNSVNDTLDATDTDSQDTLSYSIISGNDFVINADNSFTYTPQSSGDFTIALEVNDNSGAANATANANYDFSVVAGNSAPSVQNGNLSVYFNTLNQPENSGQLIASDTDGDSITYTISTNPDKGEITAFDANTGQFTYSPSKSNPNATGILAAAGTATFGFTATDGVDTSTEGLITITIVGDRIQGLANYTGDNQSEISCGNSSCHGDFSDADPEYRIYKKGSAPGEVAIHPYTSSPEHNGLRLVFDNTIDIDSQDDFVLDDGTVILDNGNGIFKFGHKEMKQDQTTNTYTAPNFLSEEFLSDIAAYMCSINRNDNPPNWAANEVGGGNEGYYDVTFSCALDE